MLKRTLLACVTFLGAACAPAGAATPQPTELTMAGLHALAMEAPGAYWEVARVGGMIDLCDPTAKETRDATAFMEHFKAQKFALAQQWIQEGKLPTSQRWHAMFALLGTVDQWNRGAAVGWMTGRRTTKAEACRVGLEEAAELLKALPR